MQSENRMLQEEVEQLRKVGGFLLRLVVYAFQVFFLQEVQGKLGDNPENPLDVLDSPVTDASALQRMLMDQKHRFEV